MSRIYLYTQYFKSLKDNTKSFYYHTRFILWCIFINEFLFDFSMLEGKSMEPTFNENGDIGLVNKTVNFKSLFFPSIAYNSLKKGDIVSVINPFDHTKKLCKRILAFEGETIKLDNFGSNIEIPPFHVWIEGDNKNNSMDSRTFGPIPKHLIIGKVYAKLWPYKEACFL